MRHLLTYLLACLLACLLTVCAVCVVNRNEDKTEQKISDIQKDVVDNQNKSEKLQNDLKQMDVDAKKLLDEHKQAKV